LKLGNEGNMTQDSNSLLASIIVVTWNAKRYVDECVRSLGKNRDAVSSEIIVVDNASTDGTPELIEAVLPQACLIRNASNLGFARANNLGIARSRGKYLFLINSDVTLPPGCIAKLAALMEENPSIGLLGPQMLGPQVGAAHAAGLPGEIRRSTMRFPTVWNQFCRALGLDLVLKSRWAGGFLMPDFAHDRTRDVEVLNGWFWVVRREALEQVGPLDERFFMYGEDIDWCYRFRQAGWRCVFYAGARAVHYGGASSAAAPVRFYLDMQRANLQYWKKHHGPLARAAYYGITLVHHLLRTAGHGLAYLVKPSSQKESAYKLQRSLAALRWLLSGYLSDDAGEHHETAPLQPFRESAPTTRL